MPDVGADFRDGFLHPLVAAQRVAHVGQKAAIDEIFQILRVVVEHLAQIVLHGEVVLAGSDVEPVGNAVVVGVEHPGELVAVVGERRAHGQTLQPRIVGQAAGHQAGLIQFLDVVHHRLPADAGLCSLRNRRRCA